MEKVKVDGKWVRELYLGESTPSYTYSQVVAGIDFSITSERGIVAQWSTDSGTYYHRKTFLYRDLDFDILGYIAEGGDIFQRIADWINEYFEWYEYDNGLPF